MGTLQVPEKVGKTVVYGMVETTDQGKREQAKKAFGKVINFNDIVDEVRVNFGGRYFDHSLFDGRSIKAHEFDDSPGSVFVNSEPQSFKDDLMHAFELEDPFDLQSDDIDQSVDLILEKNN